MKLKSMIGVALVLLAISGQTVTYAVSLTAETEVAGEKGRRERGELERIGRESRERGEHGRRERSERHGRRKRQRREHGERGHDERRGEHGERRSRGVTGPNDADQLHALVQQARSELRDMRLLVELHSHAAGPHIDPPSHHEGESEADRARERSEREGHEDGRGEKRREGREREHADRENKERRTRDREGGERRGPREREGRERGNRGHREEGRNRIGKLQKHDVTYRKSARLVLQYNPVTQAFVGSVQNTTKETLSQVRVEIHLSNGLELGPTKRINLKPGARIPVELSALGQQFTHWVTHPEAGVEEAHGPGDEETEGHSGREVRGEHARRERGEQGRREAGEHGRREAGHGQASDNRPGTASLRPLYNQIHLLRGEMRAFSADIKAKKKG